MQASPLKPGQLANEASYHTEGRLKEPFLSTTFHVVAHVLFMVHQLLSSARPIQISKVVFLTIVKFSRTLIFSLKFSHIFYQRDSPCMESSLRDAFQKNYTCFPKRRLLKRDQIRPTATRQFKVSFCYKGREALGPARNCALCKYANQRVIYVWWS